MVMTGRVYPLPEKTKAIVVKDRTGRVLPSQVVKSASDRQGNLIVAELAFQAAAVPSAGYDTYYLEPATVPQSAAKTDFTYDESKLLLENEYLRVRLDPKTGAVASLIHKPSGRETIDREARGLSALFRHAESKSLLASVSRPHITTAQPRKPNLIGSPKDRSLPRCAPSHGWKYLGYETRVTLAAGRPYVEVVSRVFAQVPPLFSRFGRPIASIDEHESRLLAVVYARL